MDANDDKPEAAPAEEVLNAPPEPVADAHEPQATGGAEMAVEPAPPSQVTLDEWANGRLHVDRYPELIAGFHFEERGAGRHKDEHAAYDERYAAFGQRSGPVKKA